MPDSHAKLEPLWLFGNGQPNPMMPWYLEEQWHQNDHHCNPWAVQFSPALNLSLRQCVISICVYRPLWYQISLSWFRAIFLLWIIPKQVQEKGNEGCGGMIQKSFFFRFFLHILSHSPRSVGLRSSQITLPQPIFSSNLPKLLWNQITFQIHLSKQLHFPYQGKVTR